MKHYCRSSEQRKNQLLKINRKLISGHVAGTEKLQSNEIAIVEFGRCGASVIATKEINIYVDLPKPEGAEIRLVPVGPGDPNPVGPSELTKYILIAVQLPTHSKIVYCDTL